jgi:ATP-dependent protease Clp ATPase subunit
VQDLLRYGMIPEFVGRLPVITALQPLDDDDLVRVLTEPKNSLVRQYQEFFRMEDGDLSFTPEALQEIAKLARRRGTGARGLRSVIEDLMRDIIFEASGTKLKGLHVVVDEQRVHALSDENSSSDNLIIEETNEDDDEDQAPASPQPDIDDKPAGETAARLIS